MRKRTKFVLLRASILLVFAVLSGRLWYVQVVMGNYYKVQGDTSKIRTLPVEASRGIIYDRYGRQLVYNAPSWSVMIVPHGIPATGADTVYRRLSSLLGGHPTPQQLAATVAQNMWRQYEAVPICQHCANRTVTADTAMGLLQLHSELPGVRIVPTSVRNYMDDPEYSLSHIVGYTSDILPAQYTADRKQLPLEHFNLTDHVGAAGLESYLDPYLHGINGSEQVEVDAGERPVRVLDPGHTTPGDSVYLTIDSRLQAQVANDLQAALNKLGLRQGIVVMEDVNSGQILAMVSLPSFNNNWFSPAISANRFAQLNDDPYHPLVDQAAAGAYPPGSTYKVVTAAAALQAGVTDASRTVYDGGKIDLGSYVFHGWWGPGLGAMNVVSAIAESSDIYFYTMVGGNPTVDPHMPALGPDRLARYAREFGLGSAYGIGLPEASGLVPTRAWHLQHYGQPWYIGDSYNSAIGQGDDLATPLQMANVAATIANGGTLYRPTLLRKIVGTVLPREGRLHGARVIQPFVPTVIRNNFIDPGNLALVQEGMHNSVQPPLAGTSFNVIDPRINAAGKTGTAETRLPNGAPTTDAWWIGYAPYENPRVAISVLVPDANAEGAYVAAPIAHKALEDYFHLKPTKANWLDDVSQTLVGGGAGGQ
ncbi:MAG TPA: penicillin-binding protein 2 [Chloroflexota bacterium]|nr:penicillin-binding protein 2 [Chloroflexota bacterium]